MEAISIYSLWVFSFIYIAHKFPWGWDLNKAQKELILLNQLLFMTSIFWAPHMNFMFPIQMSFYVWVVEIS